MIVINKLIVTWIILLLATAFTGMYIAGNDKLEKVLTIIAIILSGLLVLSLLMLIWMI